MALGGCGQDEAHYSANDIRGVMPDLEFQLTDEDGQASTAQDYAGHIVVLYFGYSHCPDICPATMGRLEASLAQLPPKPRQQYPRAVRERGPET